MLDKDNIELPFSSTCAGNAAVVKPSEVCVHTSKVMEDLLPIYIDKVRTGHMTAAYVQPNKALLLAAYSLPIASVLTLIVLCCAI